MTFSPLIIKQKIDFWPQICKFWGQKSTFSPLAANLSPTDQCFQHEKGVSLESRYEGTKSFTPCPQKIGFGAQKRPNLAQNWHFGPNIGIFGPFYLMPDQKTMWTRCLGGFSVMWVTKLMISPVKKKDFLPKNDQIWPKIGIFGRFGPGHAGLFSALLWVGWWLWRAGCISQDTYLLYWFIVHQGG